MRSLPGLLLLLSPLVSCAPPTPEAASSSGTQPAHSRAALSGGASAPVLLGDFRTGVLETPGYGSPALFGVAGGKVVYTDTDGNGYEPWVTDGTPEGTRPLGDLNPGPGGSVSGSLKTPFGSRLLMPVNDGVHGSEWWVTDGTPEGTRFIKDSVEGERGVTGQGAVMNGVFYFIADNGRTAWELWRTDATPEGTWRLAESTYGPYNNPEVKAVTVVGDALYFGSSNKLYRSDGTVEGTRLLKAFDDSAHTLETHTLTRAGRLYVSVGYPYNWSLWTSDGTPEGTRRVSGGSGSFVAEDGDRLFYETVSGSRAPYSHSLAFSQEDPATPRLLKSVSSSRSYADMTPFAKVGSQLLFAWSTTTEGAELWRTDGTPAGTVLVKDLVPGAESSSPAKGTLLREHVYFLANSVAGSALWRTDGTAEGTVEVKTFAAKLPATVDLRRVGATLVFTADDGVTGVEPWTSDGTAEGTLRLGDLNPGATGSAPDEFALTGDRVHFVATVAGHKEVWATDGTVAGTRRVKAVDPDMHLMGSPDTLGRAFFSATEGGRMKVWLSDGTVTDPTPVQVRAASNGSSNPSSLVSVGATAYFVPELKGSTPNPIVQTDGTPAGTRNAIALTSWSSVGYPSQLTPFGKGKLAFRQTYSSLYVGDPQAGTATPSPGEGSPLDFKPVGTKLVGLWWQSPYFQLWTHTESATTTTRLQSLYGSFDFASYLYPAGDMLMFAFFNPTANRWDLMRTNGTASGTARVKQLPARMQSFTSAGDLVWFVSDGAVWRSDATASGTLALTSAPGLVPEDLKAVGGRLFFTATEAGVGREPWVSDGTVAGTRRLADFQPGEGSTRLLAAALHHGTPYLLLQNAQGRFLVRTDGTPAGTVKVAQAPGATWLVSRGGALLFDGAEPATGLEPRYYLPGASTSTLLADVEPGPWGSAPGVPVFAGNRMVFAATAVEEGREPFGIELDGTGPSVSAALEGTQGGGGFYRSDVTVRFQVTDVESGTALSTVGCEPLTVMDDTPGRSVTCTAYSLGGATPFSVTVKRDATPPTVRCPADLVVTEGATPAYDVKATDAIDASPVLRVTPGTVLPVGQHTLQAEAADVAGNRATCQFQVTVLPAQVADAGTDTDAGTVDAGLPDAGAAMDAGTRPDAGTGGIVEPVDSGCGCSGAGASASLPWVLLTLVGLSRRRARSPVDRNA